MKILHKNVLINSKKFDGKINKSWRADLIDKKESVLLFIGTFDREIAHPDLGVIRHGTISLEYFWLNDGFNIFKFFEPEKTFRNFYCNVCLPPTFENNVLEYIDLDIDVVVSRDFSHKILDTEEFEANALQLSYPQDLRINAENGLEKILQNIRERRFPFDSIDLIYEL